MSDEISACLRAYPDLGNRQPLAELQDTAIAKERRLRRLAQEVDREAGG
jgi:hypothetical protein